MAELEVEAAPAIEVGRQVDAHAQVVRSPGLVFQIEHQAVAVFGGHQPIVGAQVVAAGRQAASIALGAAGVERLAGLRFELGRKTGRVGQGAALEGDEADGGFGATTAGMFFSPQRIGLGRDGVLAQLLQRCNRATAPQFDRFHRFLEVRGAQAAELRRHQHIGRAECSQAALNVLLGQDVDHLGRDADHRAQGLASCPRRADVDDDHRIDAQASRHIDRHVVDQTAVAEDPPVDLGG